MEESSLSHHHHKQHKAHHGDGRFRHFVKQTLHFVLLPVILGVAGGLVGGLLTCALGIAVCRVLAYVMRRRSSAQRLGRDDEEAVQADEKDELMMMVDADEELPPQYEVVGVVMVEEK